MPIAIPSVPSPSYSNGRNWNGHWNNWDLEQLEWQLAL